VFGVASILTPFFLAGDDRRRRVGTHPSGNHAGDSITSWFNPMSMLFAFTGVVSDAQRYGAPTSRPTFAAGRSSRPAYSF
jgi:hypothetical protein